MAGSARLSRQTMPAHISTTSTAGAQAAGRGLADVDIQAGGSVAFGDVTELAAPLKRGMAFTLGRDGLGAHQLLQRRLQARRLGRRGKGVAVAMGRRPPRRSRRRHPRRHGGRIQPNRRRTTSARTHPHLSGTPASTPCAYTQPAATSRKDSKHWAAPWT